MADAKASPKTYLPVKSDPKLAMRMWLEALKKRGKANG